MTDRWQFRAPVKQVGDREYLAADFRIGDRYFQDAMVATGFCGLVQVPENDFRYLAEREHIRGVVSFEEYAEMCRKGSSERELPVFTIEPHLDRGEFGFGLDAWKEPEGERLSWGGSSGVINNTREAYPSNRVGFADVIIEGENDDCIFTRAPVMSGRQKLIGSALISNLSRVYMSPEEIYGYLDL